jgi:hypothetical protein
MNGYNAEHWGRTLSAVEEVELEEPTFTASGNAR